MKDNYKFFIILTPIALVVLFIHNFMLNYTGARKLVEEQLSGNLHIMEKQIGLSDSVTSVVMGELDKKNLALARTLAMLVDERGTLEFTVKEMQDMANTLEVTDTVVVGLDGHIISSNQPHYLNYDMDSARQSREFLPLLEDKNLEIVQAPQPNGSRGVWYQYIGVALKNRRGFVQVGNGLDHINKIKQSIDIQKNVEVLAIDQVNYIFIVNNGQIQAHPDIKLVNRRVDSEPWYNTVKSSDGFSWLQMGGQDYFAAHKNITEEAGENITTIVSMIPKSLYDEKLGGIQISAVIFLILALCFVGIMIMLIISLDKARKEAERAGRAKGAVSAALRESAAPSPSADMEPETGEGLINQTLGLARAADNAFLYERLLKRFVEENRDFCEKLRRDIESGELTPAGRRLSALKSAAAMIGAERLSEAAARAGQSLGSGAAADLGAQVEALNAELEAALSGAARLIAKAAGTL